MEPWGAGFPGVALGIARDPQGSPERPRGPLERFLEAPKGSPDSWDSQRLGIPWLPGLSGLVGLARWKVRCVTKILFGVSCWDNVSVGVLAEFKGW